MRIFVPKTRKKDKDWYNVVALVLLSLSRAGVKASDRKMQEENMALTYRLPAHPSNQSMCTGIKEQFILNSSSQIARSFLIAGIINLMI